MSSRMRPSSSAAAAGCNCASPLRKLTFERLALCSLLLASLTAAWPTRIRKVTVCSDLHVTHSQTTEMGRGNVSLILLKNGEPVNCYEPSQDYEVQLKSNYKDIMGVLWMLDPVTGEFPLGPEPRNTKRNSVCNKPTISHYCEDQSPDSPGCSLGRRLTVGYRSPVDDDSSLLVVFRYTVVFSAPEFVENEKQAFERCPPAPPTTTSTETTTPTETMTTTDPLCSNDVPPGSNGNKPEPHENNLTVLDDDSDPSIDSGNSQEVCNIFDTKSGASPFNGNCGIHREKWNEERSYTDPDTNIDYTCAIENDKLYVRKVTCTPRCDKSGEQAICRVKNRVKRERQFKCTPTNDFAGFGNVYRKFEVEQQSKCECFRLSDVELNCPTTPLHVPCPTTAPADISNRP